MRAVTARIRIVLDIVLKSYDIVKGGSRNGVYSFCVDTHNPEVMVERPSIRLGKLVAETALVMA